MTGIQKRFGATLALQGVDLEVAPGEVHALLGENGAGKSTLMKVLSGAIKPDAGQLELDGRPFTPYDPLHAQAQGVAMIYQELNLAPDLNVAENIVLGTEPSRFGWVDRQRRDAESTRMLTELDHAGISLDTPVYRLSVAEQQVVEIARALRYDARLLIMDEPTSSLTRGDVEKLFAMIRRLKARGVSIVYISHFLEECREVADRFTVLRDGQTVGSGPMAEVEEPALVRMMVGRDLGSLYPERIATLGEPLLELRDVHGDPQPTSVSLTLRAGEILGLAGLVGAGRTETLRATFGLDRVAQGDIVVLGREHTHARPPDRLAEGVGFLSEDRKEEGLMLNQSVADNLTLTRMAPFTTLGFIRERWQRRETQRWIDRLGIRTQGPAQPVQQLSGGNQQKIALGRLLHHEARILLLDEPTRGIDVGSKAQIYRLIAELAAAGKGILLVSSYLPELLGLCDTIGVMRRGRLVFAQPASAWNEESILSTAIGQASPPGADTTR